jgi:hypothetical protein
VRPTNPITSAAAPHAASAPSDRLRAGDCR